MEILNQWWQAINADYQALLHHPFNRELANGTLAREAFRFYLAQDTLYIEEYARALALLAAKTPQQGRLYEFIEFAREGVETDKALHRDFMYKWDIQPAEEPNLATEAYSNFLLTRVSLGSFAEGLAALLPCFWIYAQVGQDVAKIAQKPNPYEKWIATYAGDDFDATTHRLMQYTEIAAQKAGPELRQQMQETFIRSVRYEWYFWDSAYHRYNWW